MQKKLTNQYSNLNNTKEKGNFAEKIAEDYLVSKNYKIIKRNFIFGKLGEIDLICENDNTLVFVEVKSFKNKDFGEPEYFITPTKQKKLRKIAEAYLYVNKINNTNCRFDVIIVDFSNSKPKINHLVNCI